MKDIERMVVSAYEDGEVEAPWKDRVEQRLVSDPLWAQEASLHRAVKASLARSPEPDFGPSLRRVASRLEARLDADRTHRFPLPWLSVAAAALLVVAAGGGFWLGRQTQASTLELAELKVQVPDQLELQLNGEGQLLMASTLERASR